MAAVETLAKLNEVCVDKLFKQRAIVGSSKRQVALYALYYSSRMENKSTGQQIKKKLTT